MRKMMPSVWGASLFAIALASAGCQSHSSGPAPASASDDQPALKDEGTAAAAIPADSPFAQVKLGMGTKEVFDTIGQPTDMGGHITGKQFIPFYFGGDTSRMVAHYKGQGRITFSRKHAFTNEMRVIKIDYDPTERGYN